MEKSRLQAFYTGDTERNRDDRDWGRGRTLPEDGKRSIGGCRDRRDARPEGNHQGPGGPSHETDCSEIFRGFGSGEDEERTW